MKWLTRFQLNEKTQIEPFSRKLEERLAQKFRKNNTQAIDETIKVLLLITTKILSQVTQLTNKEFIFEKYDVRYNYFRCYANVTSALWLNPIIIGYDGISARRNVSVVRLS